MWFAVLTASLALADDATYRACCASLGPGACPEAVEAVGAGSRVTSRADVALIEGVWSLTCQEGAAFYPWARRTTSGNAFDGALLTTLSDAAARCFASSCRLPEGMCTQTDDLGLRVVDCASSAPPSLTAWHARPTEHHAPAAAVATWERSVEQPASFAWQAPTAVVSTSPVGAAPPAPMAVAPTAPAPSRPTMVANLDDFVLPPEPPSPCVPVASLRAPSMEQTDLGDEARVAGDLAAAVGHYRAALSIDACNAYAWSSIGSVLLSAERDEDAEKALRVSTRIMPGSAHTWTELGRVRETLGRYTEAVAAYQEALVRQGDYAPAEDGLRRASRAH